MGRESSMHGREKDCIQGLAGKPKERDQEDLDVDGKIILKWTLEKLGGEIWTGFIWLRTQTMAGSSEYNNEPSGSIQCWKIFEWLSSCWLLRKDSAPWSLVR
jgi:hypothetical protein